MDVREKLVELLNKANSACVGTDCFEGCKFYMENDCLYKLIADHLIDHGVTVQEWISVDDRLPNVGSRVIACGEKGGVFIVKSEGITTGFGRMDGASKYRSFTRWIPLPELPKGE